MFTSKVKDIAVILPEMFFLLPKFKSIIFREIKSEKCQVKLLELVHSGISISYSTAKLNTLGKVLLRFLLYSFYCLSFSYLKPS